MVNLIIGLGNPGKKYEHTRHNIGFRVIDALANGAEFKFDKKMEVEIAELPPTPSLIKEGAKGEFHKILLAKPQTFMNSSGFVIQKLSTVYRLPSTNLLIIHDEIDLPFGNIRLSQNKSSAGHRGVQSIIDAIGQNFTRLRIGIDNRKEQKEADTEKYVLRNFTAEEETELKSKIIPKAISSIQEFLISN